MIKNLKNIFSAEKCLNSLILNILGIQVFRYLFARILYSLKSLFKKNNQYKEVKERAYSKIIKFLTNEEFKKLEKECKVAIEDQRFAKRVSQQTDGKIDEGIEYISLTISKEIEQYYPNLYNILNNLSVKKYFHECELKSNVKIHARLEKIVVTDKSKVDPNKEYHFDTFHHTFKAWLFLNDVKKEHGPFKILPKSHKISLSRILFEWKMSVMYSLKKINSSFRSIKSKDVIDKNAIDFPLEKNTFLMANVHALHRRGDAENNTTRVAIQFWTRENPFKIFI